MYMVVYFYLFHLYIQAEIQTMQIELQFMFSKYVPIVNIYDIIEIF